MLLSQLLIFNSHNVEQPFDVPVTFLRSTDISYHRIRICIIQKVLIVTDWPAVDVKYESAVAFDSRKVKMDSLSG